MSLIKEFAIEPRVMATWLHFQSLWEDFGVGKGRLISKYPVLWRNKVDELAKNLSKPVQATAISTKIRRDEHKFLVTGRTYNGNTDWLANAHSHAATQPFHAIIASENPRATNGILVAGEFSKDDPPYKVKSQDTVPRKSTALADCARLLLSNCAEIQFVDPHFNSSEPRFRNTFEAMLQICDAQAIKLLEIHREKPDPFRPDVHKTNYRYNLAGIVPTGVTLRVYFWSQRPGGPDMHPRFLLTDLGGINFEQGLDEGEPGETTLVTPLQHEIWQKCRTDYCRTSTTFSITPDCIIEIVGQG
jgi:hypothetical protein